MLELDYSVDLAQLQSLLDAEFEVEVSGEIVEIVEKAGPEFDILLWLTPRVVPGTLHMLITQDTRGDGDSLRCEG